MKQLQKTVRMWQWAILAAVSVSALGWLFPEQLGVLLLKSAYITTALTIGYYADRVLFYYARPHELKNEAWRETTTHTYKSERIESAWRAFYFAMIRRAVIVGAVTIAFALGL